ncbi:phenylalanine--tRNA ligase subunit alpha [Endozoicomonas sp. G2_2]|uniref:phenylalanine--tRNA ligase subunit alpha n=1 Tax=Endozoicomonas sp. G2_2 TaxID=2821092 RepID=UPI001ADD382D|nr:phenylalanine--tRNA ligase subunit alpha [Endozoicomonas sp. G2_2]MBO9471230.1 phenylalanine--tRNA ligase subunit alpha [Endozoicomonas sp. G2_2]
MTTELDRLRDQALADIDDASSLAALDEKRVALLGKKGVITAQLKQLGALAPDQRKAEGARINAVKTEIAEAIAQRKQTLEALALERRLEEESVDVTLPGRGRRPGAAHPITQTRERIERLFVHNGFEVVHGPEIEDDYHNFEALNVPPDHPARAMQDTFYVDGARLLLRTHTSPVQIRTMESRQPPIRVIAPGRVYRCDSDRTHSPMFHQVEALYVAERVSFAELRAELQSFLEAFFDTELKLRFRPSYFPFTEPSAEVDIDGRSLGTGSGWMEVLGCGMVHPRVLEAAGIDGERYTGYAIGMGVERLAMLRHGVTDLRQFYENDLRFLSQFV